MSRRNELSQALFSLCIAGLPLGPADAADCNQNGIEDTIDLGTPLMAFERKQEVHLGGSPELVAAADLDLDLVAGSAEPPQVSIVLTSGKGALEKPVHTPLAGPPAAARLRSFKRWSCAASPRLHSSSLTSMATETWMQPFRLTTQGSTGPSWFSEMRPVA